MHLAHTTKWHQELNTGDILPVWAAWGIVPEWHCPTTTKTEQLRVSTRHICANEISHMNTQKLEPGHLKCSEIRENIYSQTIIHQAWDIVILWTYFHTDVNVHYHSKDEAGVIFLHSFVLKHSNNYNTSIFFYFNTF